MAGRIAGSFAAVEWEALAAVSAGSGKAKTCRALARAGIQARQKLIARMRRAGELREYDQHPMLELLSTGNEMLSGRAGLKVTCLHLDLVGESFWALERNKAGAPVRFWPLPSTWVQDTATVAEPFWKLSINGRALVLPERDVLHFRNPDPANPYGRGTGVAEALGDEIDTDEYAARYLKTFFYNSALPAAIVAFEGAGQDEQKRAEQAWNAKFRGHWNGHRVLITNAKVDVKTLEPTLEDQQLVGLRDHERNTIIQVFGVPPEILGIIENSNRSTIDSADYLFAKHVLVDRLELVRDVLQAKLAPQYDERLIVGYVSPVPEDREYELRVRQANPAAMTRAEWREAQGLESHGPIDDVYVMPFGQVERPLTGKAPALAPAAPTTPADESASPAEEQLGGNAAPDEATAPEKSAPAGVRKDDRRPTFSPSDIESVLESLRPERLTHPVEEVWKKYLKEWGNEALASIGAAPSFDMLNPIVTEHLSTLAGEKITGMVNETTRQAIRDTLTEGVRAGEGIRDLAARVGSVFEEADRWRSIMIARTEVVGSSNFATYTAYEVSGLVKYKQWVATPDDRTRDEHAALNGAVVALDSPFTIGGYSAMYPGDFGAAEMDIQCRCTLVSADPGPKSAEELGAVWKAYDKKLIAWEDAATEAFRSGFRKQHDDVTAAMQRAARS